MGTPLQSLVLRWPSAETEEKIQFCQELSVLLMAAANIEMKEPKHEAGGITPAHQ